MIPKNKANDFTDTLIIIRLTKSKLDYLLKNRIDLSSTASEFLANYSAVKPGTTPLKMVSQKILEDGGFETTYEDNSITDPKERTKIFGQYDHVRIYGYDYFNKLRSIGFEVLAVDYTKKLSNKDINKFRLAKGEIIPVCKKD